MLQRTAAGRFAQPSVAGTPWVTDLTTHLGQILLLHQKLLQRHTLGRPRVPSFATALLHSRGERGERRFVLFRAERVRYDGGRLMGVHDHLFIIGRPYTPCQQKVFSVIFCHF